MSRDTDAVLDRRRLKRRLTFWRIFGVLAVLTAILVGAGRFDLVPRDAHVARLSIEGVIFNDRKRDEALEKIARDANVKALIVAIDSPGGTFVGGETLYRQLRILAKQIPVVAVMQGTATSAGYMVALGADHIVASSGSLTGSIGVIMQTADITGLLEKIGVKPETIKSGPLKAQPNPMEPFSPEAREATQAVISDFYDMFVDMVSERRSLSRDEVVKLADGRVFSGRQAEAARLIDGLGAERAARRWLAKQHDVAVELPVEDVKIKRDDDTWRKLLSMTFGKVLFSERLRLDGVISLWHPELTF